MKKEVDMRLKLIMVNIHKNILNTLKKYDLPYNLIAGSNIAGFEKVANAMIAQGIY